jgi:hypothetical protein
VPGAVLLAADPAQYIPAHNQTESLHRREWGVCARSGLTCSTFIGEPRLRMESFRDVDRHANFAAEGYSMARPPETL